MSSCLDCGVPLVSTRQTRVRCTPCRTIRRREALGSVERVVLPACAFCGVDLHGGQWRYCSQLCGDRYRRTTPKGRANEQLKSVRRRRAIRAEDADLIDPLALAERDGWRCGICRKRIVRGKSWPDAGSLSVDHIIPLNCDGKHQWVNVQAAHLGCNRVKQDRPAGEQLLLIG